MEKYKVPRHHLVIMTKVFFGVSEDQNDSSWFPLFQRDAQPGLWSFTLLFEC